jgi:membrane-bound serine protease (ClpP class)
VVLQLDSPGGLNGDVSALFDRFVRSEVPVVAWVGPAPARAGGGAMLFLYTSSVSAVAPGVAVGPFLPWDLAEPSCVDEACADPEAAVRAWRALRGLRGDVAFPQVESPARAAIDGGFAQVTAASIPDLLQQLDGMVAPTADGPVTLATENREGRPVEVRFRDLGPGRRVLHAVAAPTAIYVLLVLGLALLAFEATQPGFGFAGFSGLGMLGLAAYGLTIVPFAVVGLLLLLLGVGLQSADVALRRLGVPTFAGLAAFASGSVLAFRDAAPAIDVSPWLIAGAVVASFLYYGFGLTVAVRSRERITSTQRGLVGLVGETRSDLDPEGSVYVKGTLWRGRSGNGSIPKGSRVRVRGVDGLVLRVDPEPDEPPNPSDRGITDT